MSRESGLVVINPSGVDYEELSLDDLPVVTLDGEKVEGDLTPSPGQRSCKKVIIESKTICNRLLESYLFSVIFVPENSVKSSITY